MGFYQFKKNQLIQAPLEAVWEFISSPANLSKITPPHMGFIITTGDLSDKMYPGMIISYKVKPVLGIKMTWVTEITHLIEQKYFVDEQRIGPYTMWHHEHILEEADHGVMMIDIISYKPPFGFLGSLSNVLFIKKQLRQIFDYREIVLNKIFNSK